MHGLEPGLTSCKHALCVYNNYCLYVYACMFMCIISELSKDVKSSPAEISSGTVEWRFCVVAAKVFPLESLLYTV